MDHSLVCWCIVWTARHWGRGSGWGGATVIYVTIYSCRLLRFTWQSRMGSTTWMPVKNVFSMVSMMTPPESDNDPSHNHLPLLPFHPHFSSVSARFRCWKGPKMIQNKSDFRRPSYCQKLKSMIKKHSSWCSLVRQERRQLLQVALLCLQTLPGPTKPGFSS